MLAAGMELWKAVEEAAGQYRAWVGGVAGLCQHLVEKVAAARAAQLHTHDVPGTPRLQDLGLLLFRSQVTPPPPARVVGNARVLVS